MLLTKQSLGISQEDIVGVTDQVEVLRQIIARQENREVSYQEAQEIGYKLLMFYEALSGADLHDFS